MTDEKKDWRERFDEIFGEVSKKDAELVDMLEPCPHMPCSGAVKDFIAAEIAAAEDRVRAEEAAKYKAVVENNSILKNGLKIIYEALVSCSQCVHGDCSNCSVSKKVKEASAALEGK